MHSPLTRSGYPDHPSLPSDHGFCLASCQVSSPQVDTPGPVEVAPTAEEIAFGELKSFVLLARRTSVTKEQRYLQRALRHAYAKLRSRLTTPLLLRIIAEFQMPHYESFLSESAMSLDTVHLRPNDAEADLFVGVLVVTFLVDSRSTSENALSRAQELIDALITETVQLNRRTLDPLSAKLYFFYSRTYELQHRIADARPRLLALQRTATLRHNFDGQVMLLNLLLRNYISCNLFDQASRMLTLTDFKHEHASSQDTARYHYYAGRVEAVQLKYADAFFNLQQALRKGPQAGAKGFRSTVTKFLVIVQLLLGEVPDRQLFRPPVLRQTLLPYLQLVQAVRTGSVAAYETCLKEHAEAFKRDHSWTLVLRLRHNVIKAGLRRIAAAYSRISLQMISSKLQLPSEQDAEFLVATAIRDGTIFARIDYEGRFVHDLGVQDQTLSSVESVQQFHKRIGYLEKVHADAVTSMRYPDTSGTREIPEQEDLKDLEEALSEFLDEEDD